MNARERFTAVAQHRTVDRGNRADWEGVRERLAADHPITFGGTHLCGFFCFLLEPYQRYIAVARESGIPVIDVDSDGNIETLIPLWLEAGVTMLHPFEVAAGMDIVKTKREYGNRLAVRGGVDKRAMAAGSDAIDRELERIRPAVEAGGCISAVDHSVPPDVSWENFRYYLKRRTELLGCIGSLL